MNCLEGDVVVGKLVGVVSMLGVWKSMGSAIKKGDKITEQADFILFSLIRVTELKLFNDSNSSVAIQFTSLPLAVAARESGRMPFLQYSVCRV